MKHFGKAVFIIVAAISIAVFVVGAFGITSQYGDITSIIINSKDNIGYGSDAEGNVEFVLAPSEENVSLTREEMIYTKSVLEARLENYLVNEYQVNCNFDNSSFSITVPYGANAKYTPSWLIQQLTTVSDVVLYEGQTADESKVILTSENILSAKTSAETKNNGQFSFYGLKLKLDKEGRTALKEATKRIVEQNKENGTTGGISIWIDGKMAMTYAVTKEYKGGAANLTSSVISSSDAALYAVAVNSGSLSTTLQCTSFSSSNPHIGVHAADAIILSLLSALVLICIYLIYKYRLCGVATLITITGTLGGMVLVVTGMFYTQSANTGVVITMTSLFAFALTLFLSLAFNVRFYERIGKESENATVPKAISNAFKGTVGTTLVVDIVVFVIGLGFLLFSRGRNVSNLILSPIFNQFGIRMVNLGTLESFGTILMAGTIIGFLFSVVGTKLVLDSFAGYKFSKNAKLFGGEAK